MKKISKYKFCELSGHCGDACSKCIVCEAPKGRYGPDCEDCNSCRDSAIAVYEDLRGMRYMAESEELGCKDICEFVYMLVCNDCEYDGDTCNKYEINHEMLLNCAKAKLILKKE